MKLRFLGGLSANLPAGRQVCLRLPRDDPNGEYRKVLPMNRLQSAVVRYGVAVIAVALAALAREAVDPYLHDHLPYFTFLVAVTVVAWFGGLGPALLSTALGFLAADRFFIAPRHALQVETVVGVLDITSYFIVSLAITFFSHAMHKARERALTRSRELEREIAERKRAEEALRESQHDLNRAQAVAQTGSWRLDVRRNELLWSDENHRIFGIPKGTVMTYETFLGTVHPDDRAYVDRQWQAALRGEPYDVEHRIIVGDAVKWVRERAELEFDKEGALLGGFGTTQDVTERKAAEEALQQAKEELEQRVRKRTAELLEVNKRLSAEIVERKRAEAELRRASLYARGLLEASLDPLVTISPEGKITDVNKATEQVSGLPREQLVGNDFSNYFTEPDKASEGYQTVLAKGFVRDYPLTVRHTSGRTVDVLYNATVYQDEAGKMQGVFAAARDITERKAAERRQSVTNALLEMFAKKHSRKEYLDAVVEVLQAWSGCRCLGIRVVDPDQQIPYESYVGFSREFWELENWLSLKTDTCACIRVVLGTPEEQDRPVMTAGGSFYLNDSAAFLHQMTPAQQARFRGNCIRCGFSTIAVLPLRYRDQILGALHLADERKDMLPLASVECLESLTPLVAEAIRHFNAEAELRRAEQEVLRATESEQRRLGRDLHDSLGQNLTGLGLLAEGVAAVLKTAAPKKSDLAAQMVALARNAVEQVRAISKGLNPVGLGQGGLVAGLAELAKTVQFHSGILCKCQCNKGVEIKDAVLATHLYRIAQEATNNAVKHSRAKHIRIALKKRGDQISLEVQDDGIGVGTQANTQGMGMHIMKYRASVMNGTLKVQSDPGRGTVVLCSVPRSAAPATPEPQRAP
jgi:PAS domain S-box-containing protein